MIDCEILLAECARFRNRKESKLSRYWKRAYTGLLLGKKSRLRGRIFRIAKVAEADADETKALLGAEADMFPQR
jgi:hypothetical protein